MQAKKVTKTGVDRMITKMIRTSTKAPANLNKAKIAAQKATRGIREKAKKKKLGSGFWFLVLIIVIPILVVGYLILNRKVEIPEEEKPIDQGFEP